MQEPVNGHNYGQEQTVDQTWRLRVELYLRPDNSMCFRISLRSRIRPQVLTQSIIKVQSDARQVALSNIQRLADEQGQNYGDSHDASELYRQGAEALNKLMGGWKQEGRAWAKACHMAEAYEKPLATVVIHD